MDLNMIGGLIIEGGDKPCPIRSVNVTGQVTGPIGKLEVTQTFVNSEDAPINANLVFPLAFGDAIAGLEIRIGDRVIRGSAKAKEEAEREYREAKESGKKAAIVEEKETMMDVFMTSVANINAGEVVEAKFTVLTTLRTEEDGKVQLRVPMTVAPRYGGNVTGSSGYAVSFSLLLHTPSGFQSLSCPSHKSEAWFCTSDSLEGLDGAEGLVVNEETGEAAVAADAGHSFARFKLAKEGGRGIGGDVIVDIGSADAHSPQVFVEKSEVEGEGPAVMLRLFPDADPLSYEGDSQTELVFLVDRSGSMSGGKMRKMQDSMRTCLRSIPEGCFFQIVSFGSHFEVLFRGGAVPYNEESLRQATSYVDSMGATMGGTEIAAPLRALFSQDPVVLPAGADERVHVVADGDEVIPAFEMGIPAAKAPRQVILFTDGEVSNTSEVVEIVRREHQRSGVRFFSVGIGREASTALIHSTAQVGGGMSILIAPDERLQEKVAKLLAKTLQPAFRSPRVHWGALERYISAKGPLEPAPIFGGQQSVHYAILKPEALEAAPAEVTVSLRAMGPDGLITWSAPLRLREPAEGEDAVDNRVAGPKHSHVSGSDIHQAAARAIIMDLEKRLKTASEDMTPLLQAQIRRLGEKYSISSSLTSFVAVEENAVDPDGRPAEDRFVGCSQGPAGLLLAPDDDTESSGEDEEDDADLGGLMPPEMDELVAMQRALDASVPGGGRAPRIVAEERHRMMPRGALRAGPGPAGARARGGKGGAGGGGARRGGARVAKPADELVSARAKSKAPVPKRDTVRTEKAADSEGGGGLMGSFFGMFGGSNSKKSAGPAPPPSPVPPPRPDDPVPHHSPPEAALPADFDDSILERGERMDFIGFADGMPPPPIANQRQIISDGPSASLARAASDEGPLNADETSTIAPGSAPDAVLSFLVRLQHSSGAFLLSPALASVLATSVEALQAAKPDAAVDDRLWATLLALAVLEVKLAAFRAEWALLARKSQRFVNKLNPTPELRDAAKALVQ